MAATYDELYEEIRLKNSIQVEGLDFAPDIFSHLDLGGKYTETVYGLFAQDKEAHKDFDVPACFLTPKGAYQTRVRWNRTSRYLLVYEDGQYNIYDRYKTEPVVENVHFKTRAGYYSKKASDGTDMRSIAQDQGYGAIFITYSNECSLKDKGEDCLFCNINATKAIYGEKQGLTWKTPGQIADVVKYTYENEGYHHLTVSGGFIPERREVEYYLDVADAICDVLYADSFNGTACVGVPADLSVIPKYKEAGFSTIATNMETWNASLFDYICPGKSKYCGGHDQWLAALKEEVNVFGRFHVRSTFVAGLETKESLLEGISTLAELGVIAIPSQWYVNVGSAFEGHRTPEDFWHFDVQEKAADAYINAGVTWEELYNATADPDSVAHDLFRLKKGIRLDRQGRVLPVHAEAKAPEQNNRETDVKKVQISA